MLMARIHIQCAHEYVVLVVPQIFSWKCHFPDSENHAAKETSVDRLVDLFGGIRAEYQPIVGPPQGARNGYGQ